MPIRSIDKSVTISDERKRQVTLVVMLLCAAALAVSSYIWPSFRIGLGATLFYVGMVSAGLGGLTTLMGSKDMGPAGFFGGVVAAGIGWALLSLTPA